ncbi:MAG: hypothetical protein WCK91_02455 [bacterium]
MYAWGPIDDLQQFFEGKLRVDEPLRKLLVGDGSRWDIQGLGMKFSQARKGMSCDSIRDEFVVTEHLDRDTIFGVLGHLSNNQNLLPIPEGDDEADLILGYLDGMVVYLEHELEKGKPEEWHLHMRPSKPEWKRGPMVYLNSRAESDFDD